MYLKQLCFSMLIIVLLFVNIIHVCAPDGADLAKEAIDRARSSLINAYESVLDAENVGADVTSYMERLTKAGSDLTSAYLLYKAESYDTAIVLADNCYEVGEKIKADSAVLKATTSIYMIFLFWFGIYGWIGTLVIIILVSVLGWKAFKERYYRKILEMKPESSGNES